MDYDKLHDPENDELPYKISPVVEPDLVLNNHLKHHLEHSTPEGNFKEGLNGTTDSFYSSQCRKDEKFNDRNQHLFKAIKEKHPEAATMEMENYVMYGLSRMSRANDVHVASTSIAVVSKQEKDKYLVDAKRAEQEDLIGYSMFKALADFDFPTGEPSYTIEMIDNIKKEEANKTGGWNKPLPFDRINKKNPALRLAE